MRFFEFLVCFLFVLNFYKEGNGLLTYCGVISLRRQWHPTPVLLPGKSHGRRSLVGCSPWGRWGSDTTAISLSLFTFMHWRRKWQPTPVFLPGKSQRQRSLAGYSPWGHKRVRHDWVTKPQQILFVWMKAEDHIGRSFMGWQWLWPLESMCRRRKLFLGGQCCGSLICTLVSIAWVIKSICFTVL